MPEELVKTSSPPRRSTNILIGPSGRSISRRPFAVVDALSIWRSVAYCVLRWRCSRVPAGSMLLQHGKDRDGVLILAEQHSAWARGRRRRAVPLSLRLLAPATAVSAATLFEERLYVRRPEADASADPHIRKNVATGMRENAALGLGEDLSRIPACVETADPSSTAQLRPLGMGKRSDALVT